MMHKAWCCLEEVPFCFSRSSIKFQGYTAQNIVDFDPNWAFPDCNSSLNSPMAMKWCTKLEAAWERCPIVFQGHPSNLKVTRDKKLPILTQIERFWTVNPVWIQWWLWNDAQSLKQHYPIVFQGYPSNFKVMRDKNRRFWLGIGRFRAVTPVWIHGWLSIDTQSLMWYRRGALLVFNVIHKISRSHGTKKRGFWPKLGFSPTVTPVWIHPWFWNDAQSLT